MDTIAIRQMQASDRLLWAKLRQTLWPEETAEAHAKWIDDYLGDSDLWGFVADTSAGAAVGFAEVAIRKYANGCETAPVPFLEAIWIKPEFRRRGIGKQLIRHIGAFLTARGYRELGSDADIENRLSHATHQRWGFSETERVVYFRKQLR